jgi:hypothetical protein
VTRNQPDSAGPRIDIHLGQGWVDIRQQRPAIARALLGLPVEAALERIPTLLPICGAAQAVAGAGAVAAARRQAPEPDQQRRNDNALWQEQALASAWRLTVDWPDLLGEARQMAALKRVYQAPGARERGVALAQLVPGLDKIAGVDDLLDWVRGSDCPAARVIRLARDTTADSAPEPPVAGLGTAGWQQAASVALSREPFDPLDPAGGPLEVGPLAMGRDPLAEELKAGMGSTVVSRLLAQLLDVRAVVETLAANPEYTAGAQAGAWSPPAPDGVDGVHGEIRCGMGSAITARGPVFHRVVLAPAGDTVADWRVLAPTDWHFAPGGPVAGKLAALAPPSPQRVALLVASYDPCAPWALHSRADG